MRGPVTDRSPERIRAHYEIERELADRLRNSSRADRARLYSEVYDELFARVADHPQHAIKSDPAASAHRASYQHARVKPFLHHDAVFLELGAGDCALSFQVAPDVRRVYAIDVAKTITVADGTPENFELLLTDGVQVPVPSRSVTVAYSNQLMEHLHPDDVMEQVNNVYRALAPGGVYLCYTPNRLLGPHDVSRHFDDVATGFHLREYATTDLRRLFRRVGFATTRVLAPSLRPLPAWPFVALEVAAARMPRRLRRGIPLSGGVIAYKHAP